jgi:hypothetical protein
MNVKRVFNLSLVLILGLSLVNAQSDKKLLGAWKTTIDYETHNLEFISDSQLILNGETHSYSLSQGNIVVDYQYYPYTFRGEDLFVTADGVEYKLTRTGVAKKDAPVTEALLGSWENEGEYGMHKLTFHSASEAEYDGEWVGFTIKDNAFVVDYEKYLFKIEDDVLMIKWPGEADYRKFARVKD